MYVNTKKCASHILHLSASWSQVLAVLMILALYGCGIKAPPVASDEKLPVVNNLNHTVEKDRVTLTWQLAKGSPAADYYIVYRFETEAGKACDGCPMTFERIARVPANRPAGGSGTIVLNKGVSSVFKVAATAPSGREGPASGTVSVTYK